MQISVTALSITGGHLDFWLPSGQQLGLMGEHPGVPDGICDGIDGVRKKVREVVKKLVAEQARQVKKKMKMIREGDRFR